MIETIVYIFTTSIVTVFALFYFYKKWAWSYWRRRGLETYESNFLDIGRQYFNSYFYFKKKGLKHGGTFLFFHPHYVPTDLDLIKKILISDFDHFVNRNLFEYKEDKNYMNAHLFNLEDQLWKDLRNKLTPTFTSGKIKTMFKTLTDTTVDLEEILQKHSEQNLPLEAKDIMRRFTIDVIGSVALGIECKSLKSTDSEFIKFAKLLMDDIDNKTIVQFMWTSLPEPAMTICQTLLKHQIDKYDFIQPPIQEFFKNVIKQTVSYREQNNISRNDFLSLLLMLKNHGSTEEQLTLFSKDGKGSVSNLSMNELIAQSFLFFVAGYDTTSTVLTFALYQLARHPEIQEKLREEIHNILSENDGELTYDAVLKMSYLESVINETLRMYPAVKTLNRKCKKDFPVPGTDYTIKKGDMVMIPVQAMHYDSDLYPQPDEFNPDRFTPDKKAKMHPAQYIPFGEGPRMCIGSRFAHMQARVCVACIINKFRLSLNEKTKTPPDIIKSFLTSGVKSRIWLNVENV